MTDTADGPRGAAPSSRALLQFLLDAGIAVAASLLLSVAFVFVHAAWLGLQGGGLDAAALQAELARPGPLLGIAMAAVSVGVPAVLLARWRRPRLPPQVLAPRPTRAATGAWVATIGVGVFLLTSGLSAGLQQAGMELAPSNQALITAALREHPAALVLFAVVLAPVYEELLFRRVLFARLWAAGRPGVGMVLSGALFALFHEPPLLSGQPPVASAVLWLAYGAMGIAFAWVYRRTGTLWAPIGAHAINNAFGCAALLLTGT